MARTRRKLSDLVEEIMFGIDEYDYQKYLTKQQVVYYGRMAIREMSDKLTGQFKTLLLDVNPATLSVDWPSDYVSYTKIGVLNPVNNQIHMLTRKNNINYTSTFLLGSSGNPLLNSDGVELLASGHSKTFFNRYYNGSANLFWNVRFGGSLSNRFGVEGNRNMFGYYRPTDEGIELSSDFEDTQIVLEYMSDPSLNDDPVISREAEEAIRTFIMWKAIANKAAVPQGIKRDARAEHFAARRIGLRKSRNVTLDELLQALRDRSGKLTPKQ